MLRTGFVVIRIKDLSARGKKFSKTPSLFYGFQSRFLNDLSAPHWFLLSQRTKQNPPSLIDTSYWESNIWFVHSASVRMQTKRLSASTLRPIWLSPSDFENFSNVSREKDVLVNESTLLGWVSWSLGRLAVHYAADKPKTSKHNTLFSVSFDTGSKMNISEQTIAAFKLQF